MSVFPVCVYVYSQSAWYLPEARRVSTSGVSLHVVGNWMREVLSKSSELLIAELSLSSLTDIFIGKNVFLLKDFRSKIAGGIGVSKVLASAVT